MADWSSISAFATGAGTLVLALATFASVRSANRAARTAERTLQLGLRPLLMHSRLDDPTQKIVWLDRHYARLDGGHAHFEGADGVVYVAMSLRNAGNGIAVLHGWIPIPDVQGVRELGPGDPDAFRRLTRDEYVAPGDTGFFQGAVRDTTDDMFEPLVQVMHAREPFGIDILYSDHEGGQRSIARFSVYPIGGDSDGWLCSVARHWNVDRDDPR